MAQRGVRASSYARILPSFLHPLGLTRISFIHPAETRKAPERSGSGAILKREETCACVCVCVSAVTKNPKTQLCWSDWSDVSRSPGHLPVDLRALAHLRPARLDAHGASADVTRSHLAPSCRRCASALRAGPTLTNGGGGGVPD